MARKRDELIEELRGTKHIPVLIVGGGINGVGTFRDLSLQGVGCVLVEQKDFCFGASRAPSRMIHGGLKYLETGEFRLVRKSATERNRLLRNAPHYVRPLEMIIPIHSWMGGVVSAMKKFLRRPAKFKQRGALVVKMGLWLFDLYGADGRVMPRHRMISRREILSTIPDLTPDLKLAASYYDAWILSPERLVVELALDGMAAQPGNMALNHVRFVGVKGNQVELQDTVTGEIFRLNCDVMVNAAGAWIDRVNVAARSDRKMVGGTRGSHLILDLPALAKTLEGRMIYFEADGGRICIASNFMGHVLLGSTDIPVDDPDAVVCQDDEVGYLLDAFAGIFPGISVSREDIFFSYAGIRPLPASTADDPGSISRDHSIDMRPAEAGRSFPILSLIGGKWTTFRAFSAEATEAVLKQLGGQRRISTQERQIGGGASLSLAAVSVETTAREIAQATGISRARAHELVFRYGSYARGIAETIKKGERRLRHVPELSHEEIAFLCQGELVVHAEDFLFGRTSLFLERPMTLDMIEELSRSVGAAFGWTQARIDIEKDRILDRLQGLHRIRFSDSSDPGAEAGRARFC